MKHSLSNSDGTKKQPIAKRRRHTSNSSVDNNADSSGHMSSRSSSACSQDDTLKKNYVQILNGSQKPAELFRTDFITAIKVPDHEMLELNKCLVISDPWRNEWNRGVQVPVHPESLGRPSYRRMAKQKDLSSKTEFKLSKGLLCNDKNADADQQVSSTSYFDAICRYDLDDQDVRWLRLVTAKRAELGLPLFKELDFELIMESLETACFEELSKKKACDALLSIEFDEDTVCEVCQLPDSEDNNEMIFCDSCNVAVHQVCYGVANVPSGSWFCRPCSVAVKPSCMLCPNRGGAMKSTRSGQRWAHVSCALWIPEVGFANAEVMEPITSIASIPEDRWLLRCSVCHQRSGACIQCSAKNCRAAYHVTCAQQRGLSMKIQPDQSGKDVVMTSYCQKHTHSPQKHNGKEETTKITRENATAAKAKRLQEIEDEFYNCVHLDSLKLKIKVDQEVVAQVYEYWKLKRKANWCRPFMKAKQEEQQLLDKQQEGLLQRKIKMLIYLRQNLETARNLCYMVVRRERLQKQLYSVLEEICVKEQKQSQLELNQLAKDNDLAVKFNEVVPSISGNRSPSYSRSMLSKDNNLQSPRTTRFRSHDSNNVSAAEDFDLSSSPKLTRSRSASTTIASGNQRLRAGFSGMRTPPQISVSKLSPTYRAQNRQLRTH